MPPTPNINHRRSHTTASTSNSNNLSTSHGQKTSQNENFAEETFTIVKCTIYFILQRPTNSCPSPQAKRFREMVEDILQNHDVYNYVCGNLQIVPSNVAEVYRGVAENMFHDSVINWGRLVSLVAFSVKVAEHLQQYGNHNDAVIELTADAILQISGRWILANGGWGNVITHFQNKQCEANQHSLNNDTWIKGILVTATATLGLGALFAVTCK